MSIKVSHLSVCKQSPDFNSFEHDLNQLLHDIKSPISSLNICTQHMEKVDLSLKQSDAFTILKLALERLNFLVNKTPQANSLRIRPLLESFYTEVKFCNLIDIRLLNCAEKINLEGYKGDQDILKTILFNLINNSVNALSTLVTIETVSSDSGITIKISDNGKGIEKNLLHYIGKPGFSFQKTLNSTEGQGLGLSHAADTINSWGGSLAISSEVGKGTDVLIYLLKHPQ